VALIAALREVRTDMVWIGRSLEVLQMAAHTRVGGQVVIIVDVAVRTLTRRDSVHPGQREIRRVVVERGVGPRCRVVALLAGLRKARGHVGRIGSALIVLHMAVDACRAAQVEVVVNVTIGALARWNSMAAGKGKASRAMVEMGVQPRIRAMAKSTVGRESAGCVVGTHR
jgi:hypothetical protein